MHLTNFITLIIFACCVTVFAQTPATRPAEVTAAATLATRLFAEKDLLPLLTETLQDRCEGRGELELHLSRAWEPVHVPEGELFLRVLDLPTQGVSSSFITRFELATTNGPVGCWQAVLQARIWREVWVARKPIARSASLSDEDLKRERRDVLSCREELAADDLSLGEMTVVFPVSTGQPIPARALKPRALVHRGQLVSATFQDGALAITLKVEAAEEGVRGQVIKVRNPASRRDFRAVVVSESNVRISI